jgi:hypothetical protein
MLKNMIKLGMQRGSQWRRNGKICENGGGMLFNIGGEKRLKAKSSIGRKNGGRKTA